jgi:hypothetical protein
MKSDFNHGRKGFRIQINGLGLIYIEYLIICFIIDVIKYPKTFSTKFSTNAGGVARRRAAEWGPGAQWAVTSAAAAVHVTRKFSTSSTKFSNSSTKFSNSGTKFINSVRHP